MGLYRGIIKVGGMYWDSGKEQWKPLQWGYIEFRV